MPTIIWFNENLQVPVAEEKISWTTNFFGPWLDLTAMITKHKLRIRVSEVKFTEHIPLEEWMARLEEKKKLQEEAAKRNPSPGRGPRLVTPR
jgi:hypothetical protein